MNCQICHFYKVDDDSKSILEIIFYPQKKNDTTAKGDFADWKAFDVLRWS